MAAVIEDADSAGVCGTRPCRRWRPSPSRWLSALPVPVTVSHGGRSIVRRAGRRHAQAPAAAVAGSLAGPAPPPAAPALPPAPVPQPPAAEGPSCRPTPSPGWSCCAAKKSTWSFPSTKASTSSAGPTKSRSTSIWKTRSRRTASGVRASTPSITFEDGKLTIEDLNSANGTYVNRARIYPGQKRQLSVNDVIQIGTVQMKVKV